MYSGEGFQWTAKAWTVMRKILFNKRGNVSMPLVLIQPGELGIFSLLLATGGIKDISRVIIIFKSTWLSFLITIFFYTI